MAGDFEMRMRLQQVAAYRELCRGVRRSGRDNIVFAGLMAFLAYMVWKGGANPPFVLAFYCLLIGSELAVGLFKWALPSAEGHLFDGLVLLLFAAANLGFEIIGVRGRAPNPVIILIGLLILGQAINRFRFYGQLRRLFAERPGAEHMAWFDDLVREIHASDPEGDELALDLPTQPHWKARLLGSTAFFVALRDNAVLVAGPDDFELRREKTDRGTGRRKAILRLHDLPYPEFEITDATWANYQKWRAANPLPDYPSPALGGPG